MSGSGRGTWLLALGAASGIALAAVGLLSPVHDADAPLDAAAVARVNGQTISRTDYERVLSGVASDRRDPLDANRRQQVLDRLIEEELLVQRALSLGLARNDPKTRNDLVQAMLSAIVTEADARQPTDDEVAAFFAANPGFFKRPDRARIRQIFCRVRTPDTAADAERRCADASKRWQAGEDFVELARTLGDPVAPPLPDNFLPATKLTEFLGPTAANAALSLAAGAVSDPIRVAAGFRVIQVVEREQDAERTLDDVRDLVRAEMRRRAGDTALRQYLTDLRAGAAITTAPATTK